jgi:hypothetical protein
MVQSATDIRKLEDLTDDLLKLSRKYPHAIAGGNIFSPLKSLFNSAKGYVTSGKLKKNIEDCIKGVMAGGTKYNKKDSNKEKEIMLMELMDVIEKHSEKIDRNKDKISGGFVQAILVPIITSIATEIGFDLSSDSLKAVIRCITGIITGSGETAGGCACESTPSSEGGKAKKPKKLSAWNMFTKSLVNNGPVMVYPGNGQSYAKINGRFQKM